MLHKLKIQFVHIVCCWASVASLKVFQHPVGQRSCEAPSRRLLVLSGSTDWLHIWHQRNSKWSRSCSSVSVIWSFVLNGFAVYPTSLNASITFLIQNMSWYFLSCWIFIYLLSFQKNLTKLKFCTLIQLLNI